MPRHRLIEFRISPQFRLLFSPIYYPTLTFQSWRKIGSAVKILKSIPDGCVLDDEPGVDCLASALVRRDNERIDVDFRKTVEVLHQLGHSQKRVDDSLDIHPRRAAKPVQQRERP